MSEKIQHAWRYGEITWKNDSKTILKMYDDVDFGVEWKAKDIALDRAIESLPYSVKENTWNNLSEGTKERMLEMVNGYGDRGYPSSAARTSYENVSKRSVIDAFNSEIKSRIDHPKNYSGYDALDEIIPYVIDEYKKWDGKIRMGSHN